MKNNYWTLLGPGAFTLLALHDVGTPYVPQNITHYDGSLPVLIGIFSFGMWMLGYWTKK